MNPTANNNLKRSHDEVSEATSSSTQGNMSGKTSDSFDPTRAGAANNSNNGQASANGASQDDPPPMTIQQRRLEAKRAYNRKNAALTRQRTKEQIEDLQNRVSEYGLKNTSLLNVNAELVRQIEAMTEENILLRQRLNMNNNNNPQSSSIPNHNHNQAYYPNLHSQPPIANQRQSILNVLTGQTAQDSLGRMALGQQQQQQQQYDPMLGMPTGNHHPMADPSVMRFLQGNAGGGGAGNLQQNQLLQTLLRQQQQQQQQQQHQQNNGSGSSLTGKEPKFSDF